jgi:hypothetical protein
VTRRSSALPLTPLWPASSLCSMWLTCASTSVSPTTLLKSTY